MVAERFHVVGERAGGSEGVGVVRAEPLAVEVVGVLEQGAGRARLPPRSAAQRNCACSDLLVHRLDMLEAKLRVRHGG